MDDGFLTAWYSSAMTKRSPIAWEREREKRQPACHDRKLGRRQIVISILLYYFLECIPLAYFLTESCLFLLLLLLNDHSAVI